MNEVKAILIDPYTKTISKVNVKTTTTGIDLHNCYKLLDCDLVEFVYYNKPCHEERFLIVDEEGLLKSDYELFAIKDFGQEVFAGKALIVTSKHGQYIDPTYEPQIEFVTKEQALKRCKVGVL